MKPSLQGFGLRLFYLASQLAKAPDGRIDVKSNEAHTVFGAAARRSRSARMILPVLACTTRTEAATSPRFLWMMMKNGFSMMLSDAHDSWRPAVPT